MKHKTGKTILVVVLFSLLVFACSSGGNKKAKKPSPPSMELITKTVVESELAKKLFKDKPFKVTNIGQYYLEQQVVIWPIRVVVNKGEADYTLEIYKGPKGTMQVRRQR